MKTSPTPLLKQKQRPRLQNIHAPSLVIRRPRTALENKTMYFLRHRIYTQEGFIVPDGSDPIGLDRDRYDKRSAYWAAFDGNQMVGTIRAIPYIANEPFALEEFFEIEWPEGVRPQDCVEGSRAAVLPEYRTGTIFQALLVAEYQWMVAQGFRHWLGIVQKPLAIYLRRCGLNVNSFPGKLREKDQIPPAYHRYFLSPTPPQLIILNVEQIKPAIQDLHLRLLEEVRFE
jgi:N-acyl-L-homoserine lactone synthetase